MTFAITGATGQLGRLVVDHLKGKVPAGEIVAVVRSADKAKDLGVTVRQADYTDAAALETAFAGIDTVLLISSSEVGKRAAQHGNVIAAAKAAGVRRIVYTSLLHADTSGIDLALEHRVTEAELKASGIDYTILRNGWYTENHTGTIKGAVENGVVLGSAGEGKFSSATRLDFAEAAVAALTGTGHEGKTYELAGDAPYTLGDYAAEVSKQSGKPVAYNDLPEADYAKTLAGFGLPEGLAKSIANWDVTVKDGSLHNEDRQLSKLIGRPTTPLATAVAAALKQ